MWGRYMFKFFILVALVVSPLGCTTDALASLWAKKGAVQLPPVADWERDPIIQVCETAPVTVDEVRLLLEQWADHGAPALQAVASKCKGDPLPGYVQVDGWRSEWMYIQQQGAYAVTITWPYPTIESALILVADSNLDVLRHEIGHLWLPGHTNTPEHILCPTVQCLGQDWTGIKAAFRKRGHRIAVTISDDIGGIAIPLPEE